MSPYWQHLEIKTKIANIIFSLSKLQTSLCSLQTTMQTNDNQKSTLTNMTNGNKYQLIKVITKKILAK
jgi:hypothetical protein